VSLDEISKSYTMSMDWPMLYTGNPYLIQPGNLFFMHMTDGTTLENLFLK